MDALLVPVIEKLSGLLIEEVTLLKGVHREVEGLKEELEIIQPLLKDAEAKSENGETSHAVKAWINQIRVQADRIEDLVDNYCYHLTQLQSEKGFAAYLGPVKSVKPRRKIVSEIEAIKRSLHEIKSRGMGYGLRPSDRSGSTQGMAGKEHVDPRLESLFVEDDEVVGIESAREDLINKLVEGPPEFLVMSLVGQGGVGKTTLAKNVFDDRAVMECFESARAWITVSQHYNPKMVLERLVDKLQVGQRGKSDTVEDLIGTLRSHLRTKRYLIVFDDVWEESFWDEIKLALPCKNSEGSRIIITTRNSSISDRCKNSPHDLVRQISPWPQTSAFELFCKKAFQTEFRGSCPDKLLESSMEIVGKCQGLPLVIAAIAGLLATKEKTVAEWERVLCDLNSKIRMSSELTRVHKILSLSYDDLPHSLRLCYMYICLFPEDYSIADERMYRLWISESFVKAEGDKTSEEVAEEYFAELVRRNLVSVNRLESVGEGNFVCVHDLMRDLILSKAEDVGFSQIWDAEVSKFRGKGRRLVIRSNAKKALENVETTGVRTLFLSHTSNDQLTDSFMVSLFQKFKLLEVLDFESSRIKTLPKELGKMLFLKYLSLWKTDIEFLPKSINKLQKLYSLDIRETLISELPKEINELKNLQHILAYHYNRNNKTDFDYVVGVRLQEGFGENLKGLQTLTAVDASSGGVALMRELEKLERLSWLGIVGLTAELSVALCAAIGKMNRLKRLVLLSISEAEPLSLQYVASPPLGLHDLSLTGRLEKLPGWILKLQSLRGVALGMSRLSGEAIEALKGLPRLERLCLSSDAYEGNVLRFEEGGFRRLKSLTLLRLGNLKEVKIETGALLVLERLYIYRCPGLREVSSLQHLKHLNYARANGTFII